MALELVALKTGRQSDVVGCSVVP